MLSHSEVRSDVWRVSNGVFGVLICFTIHSLIPPDYTVAAVCPLSSVGNVGIRLVLSLNASTGCNVWENTYIKLFTWAKTKYYSYKLQKVMCTSNNVFN